MLGSRERRSPSAVTHSFDVRDRKGACRAERVVLDDGRIFRGRRGHNGGGQGGRNDGAERDVLTVEFPTKLFGEDFGLYGKGEGDGLALIGWKRGTAASGGVE